MRARSETTTASVVEIGCDREPAHQAASIVGRDAGVASAGPSPRGRDGAHAAAARLHAPPLGGAHVEDRVGRGAELARVRDHGLERTAERTQRRGALGAGDGDHPLPGPDRKRHRLAGAAQRARHGDHAGERLVAALLAAIAALAGQPFEATRQPVAVRQRLHAPAQGGAAIERALAVAASQFVRHRVDRACPVDQGAAAGERDDLDPLLHAGGPYIV